MTDEPHVEINGVTLEKDGTNPDPMRYIILSVGGTNDGPIDPLRLSGLIGEALHESGVEPVWATSYISPVGVRADYVALHEVWANIDPMDRLEFELHYPKLAVAIKMAIGAMS